MDRRYRDLKKLAKRYGYHVEYSGRHGHGALVPDGGEGPRIYVSGSPKNVDNWLKEVGRSIIKAKSAVDASASSR